jgi:hypothetical protein
MNLQESIRSLHAAAVAEEPPVHEASLQRILRRGARHRSRRRHRPALAGGLAALLAVALAAGLLPRGAGGPAPAAAAVLNAAASRAANRTSPPLKPGQFWYTRTEATNVDLFPRPAPPARQFLAAEPSIDEEWWGPTGVWHSRGRYGNPIVLDPDKAAWIAAGRPPLETNNSSWDLRGQQARRFMSWPGILLPRVDWNQQTWNRAAQRLQQLPTDPAALERRLRDNWWRDRTGSLEAREQCRNPIDVQRARRCPNEAEATVDIFQAATWLLARPITPPALRAALFRVLARLPGIRALGTITDQMGRSGTAVAITFNGVRHELVFDPSSSLLLAQREIIVAALREASRYPVGTTIRSELYLTRVVDSSTATS